MASTSAFGRLPRPLRIAVLSVTFVVLTFGFVFCSFPYERLRDPLADRLSAVTRADVRIGELSEHVGLLGPGLRASSIVASWPDRPRQAIDSAVVRPSWSLSWLTGTPAWHLEFEGDLGSGNGTLRLGDAPSWQGELRGLDISLLRLESALPGTDLTGRMNADLDLVANPENVGPPVVGKVRFDASDGSVRAFNLPIAVPYETLTGNLVLGGEQYASIESLSLEGPALRARLEGSIGNQVGGNAALDLAASLQADQSHIRSVLRGVGVRTDAAGAAAILIGGTLARPNVQSAQ